MTDTLKQIVKDEMVSLPKELKEAISSLDWGKITDEIGKKNLLTEEEINDFQTETFLVLSSYQDLESYALNIENNLGISKEESEALAEQAILNIFNPIYEKLQGNVKEGLKNKNPKVDQTLDFILSGGDYSAFLEDTGDKVPEEAPKARPVGTSSLQDTKDKLIDENKK